METLQRMSQYTKLPTPPCRSSYGGGLQLRVWCLGRMTGSLSTRIALTCNCTAQKQNIIQTTKTCACARGQ